MDGKLKLILLVDDDSNDNFFHRRAIEKSGLTERVHECLDGEIALNFLTAKQPDEDGNLNYPRPDLIFLDINMPKVDGWEFLEAYKNLPDEVKGGPVIVMLTTSLNPADKEKAKTYGVVDDFCIKPLKVEQVHKIVTRYFN